MSSLLSTVPTNTVFWNAQNYVPTLAHSPQQHALTHRPRSTSPVHPILEIFANIDRSPSLTYVTLITPSPPLRCILHSMLKLMYSPLQPNRQQLTSLCIPESTPHLKFFLITNESHRIHPPPKLHLPRLYDDPLIEGHARPARLDLHESPHISLANDFD